MKLGQITNILILMLKCTRGWLLPDTLMHHLYGRMAEFGHSYINVQILSKALVTSIHTNIEIVRCLCFSGLDDLPNIAPVCTYDLRSAVCTWVQLSWDCCMCPYYSPKNVIGHHAGCEDVSRSLNGNRKSAFSHLLHGVANFGHYAQNHWSQRICYCSCPTNTNGLCEWVYVLKCLAPNIKSLKSAYVCLKISGDTLL